MHRKADWTYNTFRTINQTQEASHVRFSDVAVDVLEAGVPVAWKQRASLNTSHALFAKTIDYELEAFGRPDFGGDVILAPSDDEPVGAIDDRIRILRFGNMQVALGV